MRIAALMRRPGARAGIAATAALGLVVGAIALLPHLGGGSVPISQDAASGQDSGSPVAGSQVTTSTGPIAVNSIALRQGPGSEYSVASYAQPLTTYVISCFADATVPAGTTGPYNIQDMSGVWYRLASQSAPSQAIGYVLADSLPDSSAQSASVPDECRRCLKTDPLATSES